MRLRKSVAALIVLVCGVLFCAGNLWFTAERSMIPRSINGTLAEKTIGREKHAGIDDVFRLTLTTGEKLYVDEEVFNAVVPGEHLQKESWSRQLHHGNRVLNLHWSNDVRGVIRTMPATAGILLLLAIGIQRKRSRAEGRIAVDRRSL